MTGTTRFAAATCARFARRSGVVLGAIALLALLANTSLAIPLPVGTTVFSAGEPDPIGGVVVAGGVPVPFVALTFSGTLTSTVIAGDATNPFGPGALTFTYLVTNAAASANAIGRFTVDDFAGFLTDASFQVPVAGVPPTFSDRSGGVGDVIGFTYFGAPVGPGQIVPGISSALMVVQTSATVFTPTLAAVIDGSVAMVPSFAPSAIPEPSTLVLGGLGLVGLVTVAWRRRRVC